jgi:hypothetical protein
MSRRDIVGELFDIKSRRGRENIYALIGATELNEIIRVTKYDDEIILKFLPVRAVTLIEVFIRASIAELVNKGAPFLDRAENMFKVIDLKADYKVLAALAGQKVTLGEIFGHLVRLNRLEDINKNMTMLVGKDFFDAVSLTCNRFDAEIKGQPAVPILGDKNSWFPVLEDMFRDRHVVIHELPHKNPLTRARCLEYANVSSRFLSAA